MAREGDAGEDIAQVVGFVLSDGCHYLDGETLMVDGGGQERGDRDVRRDLRWGLWSLVAPGSATSKKAATQRALQLRSRDRSPLAPGCARRTARRRRVGC